MEIFLAGSSGPGSDGAGGPGGVDLAVGIGPTRTVSLTDTSASAAPVAEALAEARATDGKDPTWVWVDTAGTYGPALRGFVRRCHDLRAVERLLRSSAEADLLPPAAPWLDPDLRPAHAPSTDPAALFTTDRPPSIDEVRARYTAHRRVLDALPGRIRLLAAAESAGALVAAEMYADGIPWDRERHEQLLTRALGPPPHPGARPAVMARLTEDIRRRLGAPALNPDSAVALLRALQAAGVPVHGTNKWELRALDPLEYPVADVLLEYKRLARLLATSGWAWLDDWVRGPAPGDRRGRFHPDYVPSAVVTGRWATHGGGAMQIPKAMRSAVAAEPGWRLVVADAAQIEPRVLAAMSRDVGLAAAGDGHDLYAGLVAAGVTDSRSHAKVGMLGALYGGTNGVSGELMPVLRRAYPKAIAFVDEAARTGERGGHVHTWLGRRSPARSSTDPRDQREWGRFTRNFIVQGTAAEWAVSWMARLRLALRDLGDPDDPDDPDESDDSGDPDESDDSGDPGDARGMGQDGPQLVYFLHDEVIVHCPAALTREVQRVVVESAAEAGRLLFGSFPITFPLEVRVLERYDDAPPVDSGDEDPVAH